jgi:hypothetical protein
MVQHGAALQVAMLSTCTTSKTATGYISACNPQRLHRATAPDLPATPHASLLLQHNCKSILWHSSIMPGKHNALHTFNRRHPVSTLSSIHICLSRSVMLTASHNSCTTFRQNLTCQHTLLADNTTQPAYCHIAVVILSHHKHG